MQVGPLAPRRTPPGQAGVSRGPDSPRQLRGWGAPLSRGGEVTLGQGVGEEHKTHPKVFGKLGVQGPVLKRSTGDA